MGIVNIRTRSERLGNLGNVRSVDTDLGAARAIAGINQAKAEKSAVPFKVASDMLQALGKGARGIGEAVKSMRDRAAREREKAAKEREEANVDAYVADYQNACDAYNFGDVNPQTGERVAGALEGTPEDTGKWLEENRSWRDQTEGSLMRSHNLTEAEAQKARRRLLGYDLSMQNRWRSHASRVDNARADANAQAAFNAKTVAVAGDIDQVPGSDEARLTWQEWRDAGERVLERRGILPGTDAARAFWREQGLNMLKTRFGAKLMDMEQTAQAADPKDVREAFAALSATLKDEDLVKTLAPDSEFYNEKEEVVADYMREALGEEPLDSFRRAALEDARKTGQRAETNARLRVEREKAQALRAAKDAALETERQLHLTPIPETAAEQSVYFQSIGAEYARLSDREGLDAQTRETYAQVAQSYGFRAQGAKAEMRREATAAVRERQATAFAVAEASFEAGGYWDTEQGKWIDMDSRQMAEQADALLVAGRIDPAQHTRLMRIQRREYTDEAEAFRQAVLSDAAKVLPRVVWKGSSFRFRPDSKTGVHDKTPFQVTTVQRDWLPDSTEAFDYGQLVKAMNFTLDWAKEQKRSVPLDELVEHFDKITKDTKRRIDERRVQQRLDDEQTIINDYRRTNHGIGLGRESL